MTTPNIGNPGAVGGLAPAAAGSGGNTMLTQPAFDTRITTLAFPVTGKEAGTITRGFIVWEDGFPGYSGNAVVNFLYNPSTVEFDQSVSSNAGVQASLLYAVGSNNQNLISPLQQTVSWSLLYDRTYELWGSYNAQGLATGTNTATNAASSVGVYADIMQMQQFTGMLANSSPVVGGGSLPGTATATTGYTGIMYLIPAYVFFGGSTAMTFYGYVSDWDCTVTHWTQYMVPMRCVIDITFTVLPYAAGQPAATITAPQQQVTTPNTPARVSGR